MYMHIIIVSEAASNQAESDPQLKKDTFRKWYKITSEALMNCLLSVKSNVLMLIVQMLITAMIS